MCVFKHFKRQGTESINELSELDNLLYCAWNWLKISHESFFQPKKSDFILNQYFPYEDIDYSILGVRASQNTAFGFLKLENFISGRAHRHLGPAQPRRRSPRPLSPASRDAQRLLLATEPSLQLGWMLPSVLALKSCTFFILLKYCCCFLQLSSS